MGCSERANEMQQMPYFFLTVKTRTGKSSGHCGRMPANCCTSCCYYMTLVCSLSAFWFCVDIHNRKCSCNKHSLKLGEALELLWHFRGDHIIFCTEFLWRTFVFFASIADEIVLFCTLLVWSSFFANKTLFDFKFHGVIKL